MTLKHEIISTQALREPEKLVGMSVRFDEYGTIFQPNRFEELLRFDRKPPIRF